MNHQNLWDAIDKFARCADGSIAQAMAREEVEAELAKARQRGHDDAIARAANTVDYMAEHDHDFDPSAYSDAIRSMPMGKAATRERERWIFRRGISVATGDLIGADDETADREIAKCPL